MKTPKIFENGRSQAVRLPKEYRFNAKEVNVNKIGDAIILFPADSKWNSLLESLDLFTDDFMEKRNQGKRDKRDSL